MESLLSTGPTPSSSSTTTNLNARVKTLNVRKKTQQMRNENILLQNFANRLNQYFDIQPGQCINTDVLVYLWQYTYTEINFYF